jgi:hypothetical protein
MLDTERNAADIEGAQLLEGHRKLVDAFQSETRDSPSIHFDRNLRDRLGGERQFEQKIKLRTMAMRAYWSLATIASLIIAWLIPWTTPSFSMPVLLSMGSFLGLAIIVPAMFYRSLRSG